MTIDCVFRLLLAAFFYCLCATPLVYAQDASTLKARHASLRGSLSHNQFQRPLHLESSDRSGELKGDIYALVEQPFATVGPALQGMDHWCEMLSLHMNVKSCRASTVPRRNALFLDIGRKFDQPLADAYPFEFRYSVDAYTRDYLEVSLMAAEGPFGTSRYRIVLQVTALDDGRSFLHMSYGYAYGMRARLAMRGYLSTIGRNKVGFTITGRTDDGEPVYIASTLGVIERNTMRYYLAIDAYLGALALPESERRENRLRKWYAGVEGYPLQLHELERDAYLDMKHNEQRRQSTAVVATRRPAVNPGRSHAVE
jgi:hypothetical protein